MVQRDLVQELSAEAHLLSFFSRTNVLLKLPFFTGTSKSNYIRLPFALKECIHSLRKIFKIFNAVSRRTILRHLCRSYRCGKNLHSPEEDLKDSKWNKIVLTNTLICEGVV